VKRERNSNKEVSSIRRMSMSEWGKKEKKVERDRD